MEIKINNKKKNAQWEQFDAHVLFSSIHLFSSPNSQMVYSNI